MTGFSRFTKQWASTGAILNPTDSQANAGFAFLGATPPSVELFNSLMQALDDKDNTLYGWIAAVLTAAGITPADATPAQLLNAIKSIVGPGRLLGVQVFATAGTFGYTPTAGTALVEVEVIGGGGGGGGASGAGAGQVAAGSGGGAGGYALRRILSGFSGATVTVGSAGAGGAGAGTNGGSSSFGAICSATGGVGGSLGASASTSTNAPVGGAQGGLGASGDINAVGGHGQPAFYGPTALGGMGGASILGAGGFQTSGTSNGNAAVTRGAGGSGGCVPASVGGAVGGAGASGIVIVREYS